jgi:hypothetical protein
MHINISPLRNLLVINWLPYKGVRAPHEEGIGCPGEVLVCKLLYAGKRRRKAAGL